MANKWVAKVLAKTVLSQESQENGDNPLQTEVKADLDTTPVASSADTAIEIAQLKQDQEDQVLISSLEEDIAEVEEMQEGLDDVIVAHDEIGEYKAAMESFIEDGGMSKQTATMVRLGLQQIANRIYMNYEHGALESFDGSLQATVLAMEEADGMLAKAWNAIVEFFKGIYNRVIGWFKKSADIDKKNAEDIKAKKEELLALSPPNNKEIILTDENRHMLTKFGLMAGKAHFQIEDIDARVDSVKQTMETVLFTKKLFESLHKDVEKNVKDLLSAKEVNDILDNTIVDFYFTMSINHLKSTKTSDGTTVKYTVHPLFGGSGLFFYTNENNVTVRHAKLVVDEPTPNKTISISEMIRLYDTLGEFNKSMSEVKEDNEKLLSGISDWLASDIPSKLSQSGDLTDKKVADAVRKRLNIQTALLSSGAILTTYAMFSRAMQYCVKNIKAPISAE